MDLRKTRDVAEIERGLRLAATCALIPAYKRFDGFELIDGLVAAQISELRHSFA